MTARHDATSSKDGATQGAQGFAQGKPRDEWQEPPRAEENRKRERRDPQKNAGLVRNNAERWH